MVLLLWRDAPLPELAEAYPLASYLVGALLAFLFHRSRVVAALLGLAAAELARAAGGLELLAALGPALLVLVGALALMRDRGLRSRFGMAQVIGSAAWMGLAWLVLRDPGRRRALEALELLPELVGPHVIPDATVVAAAAATTCAAWGVLRWRGPVERALVWCALLTTASLLSGGGAESALLLMAAGLVLAVSVLLQSYTMAYRDELTGLPGRRALVEELDDAGGTYAVAMVDVDHFKTFNDTYGHDVGDQVLQLVAKRLAEAPGGAKAFRYGGEEFTLLFPGRTCEQALPHAEAVRRSIEQSTFSLRAWNRPRHKPEKPKPRKRPARELSVTVSIGLADSRGAGARPEEVLEEADQALYRAKSAGRNRVEI
ncbi:MAG TPA: GGDEF domain-containing protein [Longimicrobiales bacterium]|nr:GGDEF domain-containing protein [Longimicrobiales bacterium]